MNTILIIMVLYIHSYYLEGERYTVSLFVQRFFSGNVVCGIANILFFLLSGILFFYGVKQAKDCFPKIRRRIRSLLIPYLIWNCIFVLWYALLKIIPGVSGFVNSNIFSNFDTFWHSLFFLWFKPASFPLWFLRDLICLVVLSPLIYVVLKHTKFWFILIYFIIGFWLPPVGLYFILGAGISLFYDLDRLEKVAQVNSSVDAYPPHAKQRFVQTRYRKYG